MHGTANIGRDLIGLDRIVAILLVLAGLAEDAAASSYPVRCAMLWGLRRANARVEDFAGRYACWMGLPPRPVMTAYDGEDREAALSLALSLRMLASIIAEMIVRLCRRQFLQGRQPFAANCLVRRSCPRMTGMRRIPASSAEIPDTS
jgi:hypothetical protein